MRSILRFGAVVIFVLGGLTSLAPRVSALNHDATADRVFGQPDFTSNTPNNGGLDAKRMNMPGGAALDALGNLYIADYGNHRVLEFDAPLTSGADANQVFGQPDFTSNTPNNGGVSADSLWEPLDVALDAQGNLYVVDSHNHRVLEYDTPLSTDTTADHVFGQPDFSTNSMIYGNPSDSSLRFPKGLGLDTQGNLYVADSSNNRVVEYNSPLTSDRIADRVFGQPDFTSNTVTYGVVNAQTLRNPSGVVLDAQGNLYVADSGNNRVLEYNTALTSDTTADRVFGQTDFNMNGDNYGGISPTTLYSPYDIALDQQGNLYVADSQNARVLEYNTPLTSGTTADGVIGQLDFSSNTSGFNSSATSLRNPTGLTLDAQGNLYVVDSANNRVLEYDLPIPQSYPTLVALSPSILAAGSPAFTLTVTGYGFVPGSIVRWNGNPRPTTFLNNTQLTASISAADLNAAGPFAVTVATSSSAGASAPLNLSLYHRSGTDQTADGVLGQPNFMEFGRNQFLLPGGANRLYSPYSVAIDRRSGRLYVADRFNHRVLSWPNVSNFANSQAADYVIGQPDFNSNIPNHDGVNAGTLANPLGVAVDAQGNLYVSDSGNNRVLEYNAPLTADQTADRVFGQPNFISNDASNTPVSATSLYSPWGLALDAQGNLYVADGGNNRVLEYNTPLTADRAADRVFGQPNFASNASNNNALNASSLSDPSGVAIDPQGRLYVADSQNNRVLVYTSPLTGATAAHVLGQPEFDTNQANRGGNASANSLYGPRAVAVDANGNLYVADSTNNRVLEYDIPLQSDFSADRVFGQSDFTTSETFLFGDNNLFHPNGLALDGTGNLFVADTDYNRVLSFNLLRLEIRLPQILR